MKSILKTISIAILIVLSQQIVYAQDAAKTITLVVSGQGKTQDEAKQNALRSAIEQAFGTFISSKTEILNDNLVKDEIVSVANGNIQKYEVISDLQIENKDYAMTLKATVSVDKLVTFIENKGYSIELNGSLFAYNIEQQKLSEKNEIKAIENLIDRMNIIRKKMYDFKISKYGELINISENDWEIPLQVDVIFNENIKILKDEIFKTLKALSLPKIEGENYKKLNKTIYPISISIENEIYDYIILRNELSRKKIIEFLQISFLRPSRNFCVYTSDPINSCISCDFSLFCFNCQNPKYGVFYNAKMWNYFGDKLLREEPLKRKNFFIISKAPFTIVNLSEQSRFHIRLYIRDLKKDLNIQSTTFEFESDFNHSKNSGLDFLITLIKKDKIIYKKAKNTNLYDQHDEFSVGYVINLNNAQNLYTQFSYFLKDKKSTDELKSITEYKVRGEFSELKK